MVSVLRKVNDVVPNSDAWRQPWPFTRTVVSSVHGNVSDWASNWNTEGYYARSSLHNRYGPAPGRNKVRRGCSCHTWLFYARASYRKINLPDTRYTLLSMRLLLKISAGKVALPRNRLGTAYQMHCFRNYLMT
jgi:hypothetical protein